MKKFKLICDKSFRNFLKQHFSIESKQTADVCNKRPKGLNERFNVERDLSKDLTLKRSKSTIGCKFRNELVLLNNININQTKDASRNELIS
ncbi:MAG: hypothetical protein ACTS5F_00145 [Candidatus Hodgkinia cicadicola]